MATGTTGMTLLVVKTGHQPKRTGSSWDKTQQKLYFIEALTLAGTRDDDIAEEEHQDNNVADRETPG
jgi:hypothetical protein